ncbi:hypothetical protein H1230_26085 [Paenibacillus sp. 19GGS1-52]|uniref:glycoside hydrolase family 78 protein n=1 Tax=Paenibacillus sp. 19GGS1-52 TaxID=2758563 RepID=UPI001EFAE226|nr:hypothetical protein [Paenibacillus sp. 19GGS1-52]ULO06449.1 hypothetical protein H1230_26085 [Paenibacillus sp. 19GGS1-52]
MVKRILCVLLILCMLISTFPRIVPGTTEVAALDTNIIQYADITLPAWGVENDSYQISGTYSSTAMHNTLTYQWSEFKITNITYNKITHRMKYSVDNLSYNVDLYRVEGTATGESQYQWNFNASLQINVAKAADPMYSSSGYVFYNYQYYAAPWVYYDTPQAYMHVVKSGNFVEGATIPRDDTSVLMNYDLTDEPTRLHFNYTISDAVSFSAWEGGGSIGSHWTRNQFDVYLQKNAAPTLSLISQNGATIQNEPGMNIYNVEGYAQDPDNDDLDVMVEIPNVYYRKIKVTATRSGKYFNIPIDAIEDSLPPGSYNINVSVVDPFNVKAEASRTLNVTIRLKNKSFVLVNSPVNIGVTFSDYESDPQYALRYKYEHDPNFFDNSMGRLADSGLWRSTMYPSFPYSGVYVSSVQAKDNPKNDDRFDPYRIWGRDNLSSMTFLVHRKPIALFVAKLVNGGLQLTDSSYDLDHTTAANKGITTWQWQYKNTSSEIWTEGSPPAQLPSTEQYDIRLRVQDVDGVNGIGAWSDWCQRTVGSSINLPPVAMFTVEPQLVSYRKATAIVDKSFDPDNDPLDVYSWTVIKDGWQQVWSSWGGAVTPPDIAAYGIGNYLITLQVHDNRGLWSEPYSQSVQVLNHPPAAAFYMPPEVYRDTVITMDNLTPDPDEDGDNLSYTWNGRLNGGAYYYAGSNRNQVMTIRDLINQNGITPKKAISEGWEMLLTASDGAQNSYATHSFEVKNHVPTAAISGPETAFQYDTIPYTSADEDLDSSDVSSLQYYWKVTDSDGVTNSYRTANIQVDFLETGVYTLEHWVVDQIGDKSNIATLKVSITKNLAPSISLTAPVGTPASPSVLDAELQGDPLIQWIYADPENDPQEKYRLEFFFTKDDLLSKTVENADSSGSMRQYQVPNLTFERFQYFYLYGRSYSKGSWSEVSNEKAFIIDNPPQPGMTLITDTGRDATKVPIYRTDILNMKSTATDLDESKGDSLSYQYYLKAASGTEGLASTQTGFTKQFTTNGTFTLRQVVMDSLGLFRELSQSITVQNRIPTVSITYPTSDTQANPTVANTLTPLMKWNYQDEDGDLQQRYKVRIINIATGAIKVQSGEQVSSAKQWQVPAGSLIENEKYAVEVEAFDGYNWSSVSPRKYFMVNLLSIKGGVQHTEEWNNNRKGYNLKQSGSEESPRGYNVYWAGERFVLQGIATGLPDTVEVTMTGGYTAKLNSTNNDKTLWTGSLYDFSFESLPNGPVSFTFTAKNEYNTKVDTVTVVISEDWSEYFQNHRVK